MATLITSRKACTVNPLKMSQPIGAVLAFLGLDQCMPALHGSQGCTAFGLVLFVRHFRENIPLQTTAMNETTTILGGMDNIEQAILNIWNRAKPKIICIASTGLTETKGDDVDGYLKLIRKKHPELADLAIVYVSTPDYKDAFQDGWARAVTRLVEQLVVPASELHHKKNVLGAALSGLLQVNVLAGSHLTPGDLDEIRDVIEAFGLDPIILPDLSGSLDGHIPEEFMPTTMGGTTLDDIRRMGLSRMTIAIGEHMRPAALALQDKAGVPFEVLDRLTGLAACDRFIAMLAELSGNPVPNKYRRQRGQLVDAMLDGHFFFGGKKIAIGAEPDLLWSIGNLLAEMGCEISAAVTTTHSPLLEKLPAAEVMIGDLEDLEQQAQDCDLLITHSHGRQMAERLDIPFLRMGMPLFDRLGAAHRLSVGYRGTRDLVFEIGNLFMADAHEPDPDSWVPPKEESATTPAASH
ncbi:nitrogenase molybdenum-cofactor biosynthesis protein NifN [Sulfuricella sp. T08]|uniref:nitrogenase iron-molybdenum cofactor biosynthesis protein NifN n=1 Tax=Sulfuricella sp. T08 TaxID=1632857 RepID=UPI000617968D|nr:nitrogenase iron-molybdenum cofactor biosynthesis protein NifN [Sulfuricella sp. T08]GAO35456.1 nitrogenase molybdenum-cofactor biosynthesis protein NifN [Sulfuricella sp. T08]